jgi:hypothetical protein
MAMIIPEIILQSIIDDGFTDIRNNPDTFSDVFGSLTRGFATRRYGNSEIAKITKMVQNTQIPVVFSYGIVEANIPCISILINSDLEDTNRSGMSDHLGFADIPFIDPSQLAALVYAGPFQPTSYNPLSGQIVIPDSVDLSQVYANLLFVDSTGTEFPILGGISDTVGSKQIVIAKQATVSLNPGAVIKSSIDFSRVEVKANTENVSLMVGVHSKDPLTTKWLYTLVKYFLLSRKESLIKRDFNLATYSGSDFARDMNYSGDAVFTRFLTVSGVIQNQWNSENIDLFDNVEINLQIPKDVYDSQQLGIEADETIKTIL